jgi:SAM-dependent methyltransferase
MGHVGLGRRTRRLEVPPVDAEAWDARYLGEPDLWGEPSPIIEPFVSGRTPGTALDLGCGNGRHGAWLARSGWRTTGVDFSGAAIEQARRREPSVRWVVADATAWRPGSSLDLVLVAYLHLPVERSRELLRAALGWLAPGGRLVHLSHGLVNLRHGVGGPQDPGLLPRPSDLAAVVDASESDLLLHRLQHVPRLTDAGTALDLLLVADRLPG